MQPWRPRCVEIRGEAEAITEPTDSPWTADLARTGFDGAIIRIHPRRIISFGIDETDTDAYHLKVNNRTVA